MTHDRTMAGLILAGGAGSRMTGHDRTSKAPKPLVTLRGRALIDYARAGLDGCRPLFIAARPEMLGRRNDAIVVPDRRPERLGPLAGIEAGLARLDTLGDGSPRWCLAVPADTPFLPRNLVARFRPGAADTLPRIAMRDERLHPTVGAWPVSLLPDLTRWLDAGQPRAVGAFLEAHGYEPVACGDCHEGPDGDPFFNVNTPQDLARAEAFLRENPTWR